MVISSMYMNIFFNYLGISSSLGRKWKPAKTISDTRREFQTSKPNSPWRNKQGNAKLTSKHWGPLVTAYTMYSCTMHEI